jgi:WD40 repeat protein
MDGTAGLWLADTHQPLNPNPLLRHPGRVIHAAFSQDGHRIATACADGTVRVWDLAGAAVAPVAERTPFSDDRSRFLVWKGDTLQVRDTVSKAAASPEIKITSPLKEAMLGPAGRFVLGVLEPASDSASHQRVVEIWETASGKTLAAPVGLPAGATNLALSNDSKRFMFLDGEGIHIRELATGVETIARDTNAQRAVFAPSGNIVAAWGTNTVSLYDASSGQRLFDPLTHPFPVKDVEFSADESRLVTCGADDGLNACYAQVWHSKSGKAAGPHLDHTDGVLKAGFSPDGSRIGTASEDFTASVWEAATGRLVSGGLAHEDQVSTTFFSPDSKWVVTASPDKTARIWSAETGEPLTPALRHLSPLASAKLLVNGRDVLVISGATNGFWTWRLPVDLRPAADLADIAQLLSAHTVTTSGRLVPVPPDAHKHLWSSLRAAYPAQFATSTGEISAWHEFQSEECEMLHQWSAAVFHLSRLLALRPDDSSIAERLARAKDQLKKEL